MRMLLATNRFGLTQVSAAAPDPAAARLLVLAERLTRTVSVARALVAAGRTVDLAGFDDGVGLLCAKSLDLHRDDSRPLVPVLLELRAQLDRLGGAIAERRDSGSAGAADPDEARAARHPAAPFQGH